MVSPVRRTKKLTVSGTQSATYCDIHINGVDTFNVGESVQQALEADQ